MEPVAQSGQWNRGIWLLVILGYLAFMLNLLVLDYWLLVLLWIGFIFLLLLRVVIILDGPIVYYSSLAYRESILVTPQKPRAVLESQLLPLVHKEQKASKLLLAVGILAFSFDLIHYISRPLDLIALCLPLIYMISNALLIHGFLPIIYLAMLRNRCHHPETGHIMGSLKLIFGMLLRTFGHAFLLFLIQIVFSIALVLSFGRDTASDILNFVLLTFIYILLFVFVSMKILKLRDSKYEPIIVETVAAFANLEPVRRVKQ